jgi:hypothetical protein
MGLGGAMALTTTRTPQPVSGTVTWVAAGAVCAGGHPGGHPSSASARSARMCLRHTSPVAGAPGAAWWHRSGDGKRWRGASVVWYEPRPLGRLGSSRLPAVHRPPIDPVISRGSYLVKRVRRLILGRASHLDAVSGYPCRTWLPSDAVDTTTGTPAVRPARSSRTRASPPQPSTRPRRIETELSHDVLNPARVPLSWANSPTLGTASSPRMRRADIEVPNPAVDMDSWAGSACYPRGSFYPLSHGPSTRNRGITMPGFRPCSGGPPRSQAPLLPLHAPAGFHAA